MPSSVSLLPAVFSCWPDDNVTMKKCVKTALMCNI